MRLFPNTRIYLLVFVFFSFFRLGLNAQCAPPTFVTDPQFPCDFPFKYVAQAPSGSAYATYKWDNGETTNARNVTANGTYTVTITCTNGETVIGTGTLNFQRPSVSMSLEEVRPCLIGETLKFGLNFQNARPGIAVVTIQEGTNPPFNLDFPLVAGANSPIFTLTPTVPNTSIKIISAVYLDGCPIEVVAPLSTTVVPFFQSESEYPFVVGNKYFCKDGETTLEVLGLEFLGVEWTSGPMILGTEETLTTGLAGPYLVKVLYGPQCTVSLNFDVDEIIPMPEITGGPVCSGNPATLSTTENYVLYEWSNGDGSPTIQIEDPGIYRVTITDDFGCTGFDAITVPEFQSPVPNINGPIALCTGQTTAILVANGFNISTYEWSTGSTNSDIQIMGPGEYTVTVTSNQGCTAETTQTVDQITTPTVDLTSPNFLCSGNTVTLTPTVTGEDINYQWSNGATTSAITVSAGGVYRVTVYDPSQTCTSSDFALVTVLPSPVADIVPPINSFCQGSPLQITADTLGSTNNYIWSTGATTNSINVDTTGNYYVTVTAANGCTDTDSLAVTRIPAPKPAISGPRSLCGLDSVLISTTAFADILWSTGDTTTGVWVKTQGTYNVVVTDTTGCSGTASITVFDTEPSGLSVAGANTLCGADSLILVASGPFVSYNWTGGIMNDSLVVDTAGLYNVIAVDSFGCVSSRNITITNQGGFTTAVNWSPLCNGTVTLAGEPGFSVYQWSTGTNGPTTVASAAGTYTVTVTNAAGCTGEANYEVTVLPNTPNPDIIAPSALCQEGSTIISISQAYQSYEWSTGATTATLSVQGANTVGVTVTDEYGCAGSEQIVIGTLPSPMPNIAGSQTICNGEPTTLSVSSNFNTFFWSTGATSNSISVNQPGNYSVLVTNNSGCVGNAAITITASNVLSPNIAAEPYNCDETLTLNAGGSYDTYSWSTGSTTSTISITAAGDYSLTVTDNSGCTGTAILTVESIPSTPALTVSGATSFCSNQSTMLTAVAGFDAYLWNTGSNNPSITISTAGDYDVTATDANGCTVSTTVAVSSLALPQPNILVGASNCDGMLSLATDGTYVSYLWSDNSDMSGIIVTATGTYTVTVTDDQGCTGTSTEVVTNIPNAPVVSIAGSNQICAGASTELAADAGFVSYAWSTGDTTESVSVMEAGTFDVVVTDANGCTGTASVSVEVLELPVAEFTPVMVNCNPTTTLELTTAFESYEWSTGTMEATEEVSVSGTYTVTVTNADGCTGTAETMVNIPVLPSPEIISSNGTNYTVNLDASAGFDLYAWSTGEDTPGINVTTSGTYTVTATNANGCTGTAEVGIEITIAPLVVTATSSPIACNDNADGQIDLCINGGVGPYIAATNPASTVTTSSGAGCAAIVQFSGLGEGTYTWTVIDDNGVEFTGSSSFTNPPLLVVGATVSGSTITGSATGGEGPYQYSIDGGVNYQSDPVFTGLPNGAYQVLVQDALGCTKLSPSVTVFTVGLNDPASVLNFQVNPNPGNGYFYLSMDNCGASEVMLEVWTVTGVRVLNQHLNTGDCSQYRQLVDLSNQPSGTYILQVRTAQKSGVVRLIKG